MQAGWSRRYSLNRSNSFFKWHGSLVWIQKADGIDECLTVVDNRDNLKFRFQEFFTSLGDQGVIISDDDSRAVPFNSLPHCLGEAQSPALRAEYRAANLVVNGI